jgi:hypothetical protein
MRSMQSKPAKDAQAKINKRNRRYWQTRRRPCRPTCRRRTSARWRAPIVVDWRGKGYGRRQRPAIPCTDAMKELIFGDPSMWEFRQQVLGAANNADNFRKAELEADAKNSSTSSAGSSAPTATSPA